MAPRASLALLDDISSSIGPIDRPSLLFVNGRFERLIGVLDEGLSVDDNASEQTLQIIEEDSGDDFSDLLASTLLGQVVSIKLASSRQAKLGIYHVANDLSELSLHSSRIVIELEKNSELELEEYF